MKVSSPAIRGMMQSAMASAERAAIVRCEAGKGLTLKTGQTHTHRYLAPLLEKITTGEIDPSFVITHRAGLEDGPGLYQTFRDKEDGCIKVVLTP